MTTFVPLIVAVLLAVAVGAEKKKISFENRLEHVSWADYKLLHGKSYESKAVELDRMLTFLSNKEYVRRHNEDYAQGKETHWLTLNKFADLKLSEFKNFKGFNHELAKKSKKNSVKFSTIMAENNETVPTQIDHRKLGLVSEVKDQGQCGSCWAFSATGSMEGQQARKTGVLVSLSEQNLVDCSTANYGCDGGLMDYAFEYVIDNEGLDTEESYPYEAEDGKCRFTRENVGVNVTDYVDVDDDENILKAAVGLQGPISVAIDANHGDFMMYGGGVYKARRCSSTDLDHGVLAVGYDTDKKGGDYWIVKNSWGEEWGEEGYIKMARNRNNMCGITTMASYPIV